METHDVGFLHPQRPSQKEEIVVKKGGEISRSRGEPGRGGKKKWRRGRRGHEIPSWPKKLCERLIPVALWAARDACFTEKILPLLRISQINAPKLANLSYHIS